MATHKRKADDGLVDPTAGFMVDHGLHQVTGADDAGAGAGAGGLQTPGGLVGGAGGVVAVDASPAGAQAQQQDPLAAQVATPVPGSGAAVTPGSNSGGSASKKQRTWERHRWTFKHDEALFDQVIAHDAWSKKFGQILKSWGFVAESLQKDPLFQPWGTLKTDMLRRRFDKLYQENMMSLQKRGIELDAVREEDLTEVERKVIRIKDLMSVAGLNPEVNMDGADGRAQGAASMKSGMGSPGLVIGGSGSLGGSTPGSSAMKKTTKMREEELSIIKETVAKFLERSSANMEVALSSAVTPAEDTTVVGQWRDESMDRMKELLMELKGTSGELDLADKVKIQGDLVEKVVAEQFQLAEHLAKQNELLLGLLTKVLGKNLG